MCGRILRHGFNHINRRLRPLADKVRSLDGSHQIPLNDLFPFASMWVHIDYLRLDAMAAASGSRVESPEDFAAIPDAAWDDFVACAPEP